MVGFDFLLHASLLSSLYLEETSFLLDPTEAFRRIPIGYISFYLVAILLFWLAVKLNITTTKDGFLLGLQIGALMWISLTLGLYSISTAPSNLLLGWAVGQTVEMALGGAILGFILETGKLKESLFRVVVIVILCIILGIILQNI